jgi:hypothetical protein
MFDFDITDSSIFLLICVIWVIAYVFVVYDLITFISRIGRPSKLWRHIFESTILTGAAFVWLNLGDQWALENNLWRPTVPVTGTFVLLAYLYSSYRKRIPALWLEVVVQVCLLVGVMGIMGFTVMTRFYRVCLIVGIPPCILFISALFPGYQRSGSPKIDRGD